MTTKFISFIILVQQVLRHFAATLSIAREHVQVLLTLLHKSQATIAYSMLPKTVENLLKVPEEVKNTAEIRSIRERGCKPGVEQRVIGQMLYFGIQRAIEGTSCGIDAVWKYVKDLSLINILDPNMLTQPFLDLIATYAKNESCVSTSLPNHKKRPVDTTKDPLCVMIDLFADGFAPYRNCSKSYWAVYGIVTSIGTVQRMYDLKGESSPLGNT